jgi:serine/threonine-protein kinase
LPTVASPPAESESGRELLQQRISLLAKVMVGLGAIVQLLSTWIYFFAAVPLAMSGWEVIGHIGAVAGFAAIWARTRSGVRSASELAVYDVLVIVWAQAYWWVALWDSPPEARAGQMLVFGAANLVTLRAVLIPSTARRTAAIGLCLIAVTTVWTYLWRSQHDVTGEPPAFAAAGGILLQGLLAVVISTVASHTIFGLRQAVRKAMQLGQYTLLRKIGEGGMGVVWEAKHAFLRRRTAVKLLPPDRAGEEAIARFEREVQLTSTLTHPNTIAIYDYGRSAEGVFYYAMEHLDGIDLQALVERDGPQPPGLVARVLGQICDSLAEAHGVGLIHRDVKPANVILCERGGAPLVAKVLDFGLVRPVERAGTPDLSAVAAIVGTPLYIAPEAIATPGRIDARSDLYSVGAVGYYLLTGMPPFEGPTAIEIFAMHMHKPPVAPSERLGRPAPPDLESILLDCLEKDPDRRPRSAAELSTRLSATEAARSFGAGEARAAWERCRALAGAAATASPASPTQLTIGARS